MEQTEVSGSRNGTGRDRYVNAIFTVRGKLSAYSRHFVYLSVKRCLLLDTIWTLYEVMEIYVNSLLTANSLLYAMLSCDLVGFPMPCNSTRKSDVHSLQSSIPFMSRVCLKISQS